MPQITLSYSNTYIMDGFVSENTPTSSYGTGPTFTVGKDANGFRYYGLLYFDFGLIPNNAIINSATLGLYKASGDALTVDIHAVTSDWSESSTWNTKPSFEASPSASFSVTAANQAYTADVKNLVQRIVNGENIKGFLLKYEASNLGCAFMSRENGATGGRPTLTIDYTIPSTGKKQVEYVGYSANHVSGGSITATFPNGIQPGDLLVAVVSGQFASGTITLPSEWTVHQNKYDAVFRRYLISKIAGANEPAPIFSSSQAASINYVMHAFRNVKSIVATGANVIANSTDYSPPTTSVALSKLMSVLINLTNGSGTFTPPLNYAEQYDVVVGGQMQMSYSYLHSKTQQSSSEMLSKQTSASSGQSMVVFLEPITNNPPTLTLTSPTDNQTLSEGSTYTLAGTASDPDNGNAVTVKYSLNGGTARNITSAISDGASPIPFSKVLTFQNGRLYDGGTDVSGPLAENTTYTVSVYAVDDRGGTSPSYTRSFKVVLNRPPAINLDPYNANQTGLSELETLTFTGTVTDPDGDNVNLTVSFNGGAPQTLKSGVPSGTTFEYPVPVASLKNGTNTVVFTATDTKGAEKKKTLTFAKSGTFAPVKTAVTRYAITPPLGSTAEIVAWVHREIGDLNVDAAFSIVGSDANETYAAMTKTASVPVGDGTVTEDEFVGTAAQPGAKVTLRLTLTRTDASADRAVKKIMGGIG